jgi:hypothetical protein
LSCTNSILCAHVLTYVCEARLADMARKVSWRGEKKREEPLGRTPDYNQQRQGAESRITSRRVEEEAGKRVVCETRCSPMASMMRPAQSHATTTKRPAELLAAPTKKDQVCPLVTCDGMGLVAKDSRQLYGPVGMQQVHKVKRCRGAVGLHRAKIDRYATPQLRNRTQLRLSHPPNSPQAPNLGSIQG